MADLQPLEPSACPACEKIYHQIWGDPTASGEGRLDVYICRYCGHLMTLGADQKLRSLTLTENRLLRKNPRAAEIRAEQDQITARMIG